MVQNYKKMIDRFFLSDILLVITPWSTSGF